MADRAPCIGCSEYRAVTAAGVIRVHQRKVWDLKASKWLVTDPCPGAGKPPKGVSQAAVAIASSGSSTFPARAFAAQQKAYAKAGLDWPPKPRKPAKKD